MLQNQEISKKKNTISTNCRSACAVTSARAIADFNMIEEGDRIMVCLSGGKDSYTMLEILRNLQKSAPISFSLVAVNLDQNSRASPNISCRNILSSWALNTRLLKKIPTALLKKKIPEGKTTCSLCSRLRRGILYRTASEAGRDQNRPGPPPRRYPADPVPEHVLRREDERYAAEVDERRR